MKKISILLRIVYKVNDGISYSFFRTNCSLSVHWHVRSLLRYYILSDYYRKRKFKDELVKPGHHRRFETAHTRPCVSMVDKTFLPAKSKQETVLKWMLRLWNLPFRTARLRHWNVVDVIRRSPETSYLQRFDILNENRNLLWCVFMSRLLIHRDDIKRV